MRVLFYGGCHATVLRQVFTRYATGAHHFDDIRNYWLIQSGAPFPYEQLSEFDAVVFSPVTRKEHSTETLLDFCHANGIAAISYPWVQWQALYPHSKKGPFLGGTSWRYDELFQDINAVGIDRTAERSTGSDLDEGIRANFAMSHAKLIEFEKRFDTDIRLSSFIRDNYKSTRMFLTPDHPTQALYCHLVSKVSEKLGIEVSSDFYYSGVEPQRGVNLPIIPRVSDVLGLSYRDSDYENATAFGSTVFNWRDYLRLYTEPDALVFESEVSTQIKRKPVNANDLVATEKMRCPAGTIFVAKPVGEADSHIEVTPVIIAPEARRPEVIPENVLGFD